MKPLRPVTVKLDEDTYNSLRKLSYEENRTIQDIVSAGIFSQIAKFDSKWESNSQ